MQLSTIQDVARQLYLGININSTDFDSNNRTFGSILLEAEKLIPDFANYNKKLLDRNDGKYHITIFNVAECGKYPVLLSLENLQVKNASILFKGIGSLKQDNLTTWFVVVESPVLNSLRSDANMYDRDLHITIAFTDKDLFKGRKNVPDVLQFNQHEYL